MVAFKMTDFSESLLTVKLFITSKGFYILTCIYTSNTLNMWVESRALNSCQLYRMSCTSLRNFTVSAGEETLVTSGATWHPVRNTN